MELPAVAPGVPVIAPLRRDFTVHRHVLQRRQDVSERHVLFFAVIADFQLRFHVQRRRPGDADPVGATQRGQDILPDFAVDFQRRTISQNRIIQFVQFILPDLDGAKVQTPRFALFQRQRDPKRSGFRAQLRRFDLFYRQPGVPGQPAGINDLPGHHRFHRRQRPAAHLKRQRRSRRQADLRTDLAPAYAPGAMRLQFFELAVIPVVPTGFRQGGPVFPVARCSGRMPVEFEFVFQRHIAVDSGLLTEQRFKRSVDGIRFAGHRRQTGAFRQFRLERAQDFQTGALPGETRRVLLPERQRKGFPLRHAEHHGARPRRQFTEKQGAVQLGRRLALVHYAGDFSLKSDAAEQFPLQLGKYPGIVQIFQFRFELHLKLAGRAVPIPPRLQAITGKLDVGTRPPRTSRLRRHVDPGRKRNGQHPAVLFDPDFAVAQDQLLKIDGGRLAVPPTFFDGAGLRRNALLEQVRVNPRHRPPPVLSDHVDPQPDDFQPPDAEMLPERIKRQLVMHPDRVGRYRTPPFDADAHIAQFGAGQTERLHSGVQPGHTGGFRQRREKFPAQPRGHALQQQNHDDRYKNDGDFVQASSRQVFPQDGIFYFSRLLSHLISSGQSSGSIVSRISGMPSKRLSPMIYRKTSSPRFPCPSE